MPTTTPQLEAPRHGDFYAVVFETLGGATVGFVGKHVRSTPSADVFEDLRTGVDVLVPHATTLSRVVVDGPWLSARELAELTGS